MLCLYCKGIEDFMMKIASDFVRSLLLLSILFLFPLNLYAEEFKVPILLYHRFANSVNDSMTITNKVFASHLEYLNKNGYKVIPLRQLIDFYIGKSPAPPKKSVVIVADDAHKSVYTDMYPMVKKYRYPVTVFAYPSAVSNAKYAMTWDQLRELKKSNLFDIQSHTYWHPNFKKERRKLSQKALDDLVLTQLRKSKARLETEIGTKVDMLAWPFGIYDDYLISKAKETGYISTFTIERRHATAKDSVMKLPRYLLVNADNEKAFAQLLNGNAVKRNVVY